MIKIIINKNVCETEWIGMEKVTEMCVCLHFYTIFMVFFDFWCYHRSKCMLFMKFMTRSR